MKRSSIFYTITFIFILAIISISLAFLWLMDYDKQNYTRELNAKYSIVSRATLLHMTGLITDDDYESQMKNFKMPEVVDKTRKNYILNSATIIQEITADIGSSAILLHKKKHFLRIRHADATMLLQDSDYQPYRYDIIKVIFSLVFLTVLITYIFIIRKIKPLRRLKRQINKFANGDLDISNVSTGNDEISEVADAFYNSVMQIKKLNESRQLFLRNIMHELKTPITKGRITVEMIEKGKYQDRLISVFEKLEDLINEFAAVERATAGIGLNEMGEFSLQELIDEAIKLAMIDKNRVEIMFEEDIMLQVDFKLFSIAIKNMIDNGMKYSLDRKIKILANQNSIEFHTLGSKLDQQLEFYIEPFSKGKNAKQSFGLGLYIVDNILKSHGLKFSYKHTDEINIFSFENIDKIIIKEDFQSLDDIDNVS
ncbi:ArsS family sensor histidine kinase [Campylobacter geochelonis]|uniref:ArsS family sensor histidine kinase n=1 Tax=Campylobacter geochelonis TaxID=1780362 RepID=UPI0007707480|nr:ArsS family sensor histidine kinase [Campylobacter geochelonis]CZE47893.1 sensor histidine kinase [Campylobacter geochelonis]CZE50821.1 sensor histidine kinase [Campylobacter geochelonis]